MAIRKRSLTMRQILFSILVAVLATGCAGLTTRWVLHMEYQTPLEESKK